MNRITMNGSLEMKSIEILDLYYYGDFVFLQLFQPIMAQLGNFDCHGVL